MENNRQNLIGIFTIFVSLFIPCFFLWVSLAYAIDKQLQNLQHLASSQPNDANAHFNLGVYYFQNGQLDESIGPLKKACALNQ